MNYLRDKRVYLTGAITDDKSDGRSWRSLITPRLADLGISVDDPTKNLVNGTGEIGTDKAKFRDLAKKGNWDELKETFAPIIRKDLRSVDFCDFLIWHYDPSQKLMGTLHEVCVAQYERKPILIYIPKDKVGDINPWVTVFADSDCVFTEWDDLFKYLDRVNNGDFPKSHWTL